MFPELAYQSGHLKKGLWAFNLLAFTCTVAEVPRTGWTAAEVMAVDEYSWLEATNGCFWPLPQVRTDRNVWYNTKKSQNIYEGRSEDHTVKYICA